uniref:Uncharacterized protein n=1 Tax=Lactuca sativa TaxID=4236 RepID=A0A9R1UPH8_LACSA|nr:hypothetical protein LSAT_V11C800442910 [Lactuca sativa]
MERKDDFLSNLERVCEPVIQENGDTVNLEHVNEDPVNQENVNEVPVNQDHVNEVPVHEDLMNEVLINQYHVIPVPVNQVPVNLGIKVPRRLGVRTRKPLERINKIQIRKQVFRKDGKGVTEDNTITLDLD